MSFDDRKGGWVKLHKKITEWEWYTDGNVMRVFLHLLINAMNKNCAIKGVKYKKGQLSTGRKRLARELGLSEQQVRTALKKLEATKEITIKPTKEYSIITLNNWEQHQQNNQDSNQPATNLQPTCNQPLTTEEEIKEIKEIKEVENFYGEYSNVYLTKTNYGKLLSMTMHKSLLEEIIDNLDKNIECGKEKQYDENLKNAHFIRLEAYLKQRRQYPDRFINNKEEYNAYR